MVLYSAQHAVSASAEWFNPTDHLIDAFVDQLDMAYRRTYRHLEPDYPGMLGWAVRMALEHVANSDVLYHNVEHTCARMTMTPDYDG